MLPSVPMRQRVIEEVAQNVPFVVARALFFAIAIGDISPDLATVGAGGGLLCVRRRVLIAGLGAGRSYTFVVHAENGVSDQSSNDAVRRRRITVSTQPAGARDRPSAVFLMHAGVRVPNRLCLIVTRCWREEMIVLKK